MHRAWIALSQVKALLRTRPGNTIPSISPMCAQARRRFTQVIHMVVHSKRVRRSLARLAGGAGQRAGACVRRPARRMPDLAWARKTSPKKAGTGCSPHTPWHAQAARAQSPPTPVPPPALPQPRVEARGPVPIGDRVQQPVTGQQRPMPGRWPGGVSLLSSYPDQRGPAASRSAAPTRARAQEAGRKILDHHSQPCLGPSHYCTAPSEIPGRPIRDLRPSGPAGQTLLATARHPVVRARTRRSCTGLLPARRPSRLPPPARRGGPGTTPCSAGPPIIAAGIPALAGVPARPRRSCRAESGTAPPCMRWRGRARPRRAGWPVAWSSPRAARRPPGPGTRARGRSPGSSRVPGVAPGWCPFPAVKAFLLPPRAPRKALRPAISCFSAIHEGIHRKQAVIRISQRLFTGLLTACPQATGVSFRIPEPLSSHAIG